MVMIAPRAKGNRQQAKGKRPKAKGNRKQQNLN